MSQLRAEEILPRELIETIQQYVSGKSIYIPCREKKDWGSQTQSRQYYGMRNHEICEKYKNGVNANGNRVDVWLIYRCKKCKHSWNLTIYERKKPAKIAPQEYELFMENDAELARLLIRLSLARDPSGASGTIVLCGGSDNDRFIWNNMFKSDV